MTFLNQQHFHQSTGDGGGAQKAHSCSHGASSNTTCPRGSEHKPQMCNTVYLLLIPDLPWDSPAAAADEDEITPGMLLFCLCF